MNFVFLLLFLDTWTLTSAIPGWSARYMHTLSYLPAVADSLVLTGGAVPNSNFELGDVWKS